MQALGTAFGLEREDSTYALLVLPVYLVLMAADLTLIAATAPGLTAEARRQVFRETGLPTIPLELLCGIMAAATVLIWAHAGIAAAIGLLVVLLVTIPLARSLGSGMTRADDIVALREVSDQRAAEVSACRRTASGCCRRFSTPSSANAHVWPNRSTTDLCNGSSSSGRTWRRARRPTSSHGTSTPRSPRRARSSPPSTR